jgi:hypothetical protein
VQPITVAQGVAGLEELKAKLTRTELKERAKFFDRAERWIRARPPVGVDAQVAKSFDDGGDIRVDIEIRSGRNFTE